jgi:hypothetical protein
MTGFIAHLYNLLLHFTIHYMTHSLLFSIIFDCHLKRLPQFSTNCSFGTPEFDSILILAGWDPRYIASERTHRKHLFLYCCLLIHCCKGAARTQRELRLQHLFYCCLTSQRTWRVPLLRMYGPSPGNSCFSASTVLTLSKYATIFYVRFILFIHCVVVLLITVTSFSGCMHEQQCTKFVELLHDFLVILLGDWGFCCHFLLLLF